MASTYPHLLRHHAAGLTGREVLEQPTDVLLGVSAEAARVLRGRLGIRTIFDLASSATFAAATRLADGRDDPLARPPGDVVDDGAHGLAGPALAGRPIEVLRSVSDEAGRELANALSAPTLRDFALWPPYRAARAILNEAFGFGADGAPDPESPPDLLPATGRFPTERVQYDVLVFDKPAAPGQTDLTQAGPIDVAVAAEAQFGFTAPALGALLTYRQSWYNEGLALGQLLHTLALAPGESTRIAMLDWSRRVRSAASEDIGETEALTSALGRTRSISEVTSAVATESQQGFSASQASGTGASFGIGGGLALGEGGAGASVGGGFARSWVESQASSWSSSSGRRDLNASMTQNIVDRTHQASNVARNRRATIVQEVSEDEREGLSSRAVTNYNHMHALSIEYFEVVQLYRVVVELARVTRCLFIPMKLVDFQSSAVISRFRRAIAAAGLTPEVRALRAAEPNHLSIAAPHRDAPWDASTLLSAEAMFGEPVGEAQSPELIYPLRFGTLGFSFEGDAPYESVVVELRSGQTLVLPIQHRGPLDIDRLGSHRVFFPSEYNEAPSAFWDVRAIRLRKQAGQEAFDGQVTASIPLERRGPAPPASPADTEFGRLNVTIKARAGERDTLVFQLARTLTEVGLRRHLVDNALYYSQAVWRSLDAATLGLLLSPYTYGNRSVVEIVDPLPVSVAGNYLVFRMYGAPDQAWIDFLRDHDLAAAEQQGGQWQITYRKNRTEDLVPLPSEGVFAEAVLGRFNAAEKLDITRFWNWQDSPIPITAPEIAALSNGSRARTEPTAPGQLGAPVLNVVNAPALPDPQGLGAVLGAISNGSMFRDMSGLAATIGLAQAAMGASAQGASSALQQAGGFAATAANLARASLGGDDAGGAAPAASRPVSPATISNAGARINHGARLDGTRLTAGADERPAMSNGRSPAPGGMGWGAAGGDTGASGSQELDAFRADLGTPAGAPIVPATITEQDLRQRVDLVVRYGDLLTYVPPPTVIAGLNARGMHLQRLADGAGDLNADLYEVRITTLPEIPGANAGQRFDAAALFEHVRQNLPTFVDPMFSRFAGMEQVDDAKWASNDPAGTVFFIDIPGPDNAAVVASLAEATRWRFSTIWTPQAGEHPVSGTREFGYTAAGGAVTIFTRGVDRPTNLPETVLAWATYLGQASLWKSFQDRVAAFVREHGGQAEVRPAFTTQVNWGVVRRLLTPAGGPVTI